MIPTRTLTLTLAGLLLAVSVRAAEPDRYLPDNTTSVVSINVKQSLGTPLGKKYLAPVVKDVLEQHAEATKAFTALGFDPLKDIDSIVLASPGIGSTEIEKEAAKAIVILHGSFDLTKVHAAGDALMKEKPTQFKMSKEGDVRVYDFKNDKQQTGYLAFIDRYTAVVSANKDVVASAIKSGGKGPKLSKDMTALVSKIDGKQSVWFGMLVSDEIRKGLAQTPQTEDIADKLNSISAGVTVDADAVLKMAIHTADARTAESLKVFLDDVKNLVKFPLLRDTKLQQQLGSDTTKMLATLLDSVITASVKNDTTVDLKLNEETIGKLIQVAQPKKP